MPSSDHFAFETWKGIKADSGRWYKAVELLGTGGNAATFLAISTSDPTCGLLYAVKVFRRLSKPERKANFLAEAKFLQLCNYPGIMQVFDEGTYYDDNPFMVVEYLPRTLAEVMRGNPGILEKTTYALQLVSAISYLGAEKPPVVHRDIKPGNIFIKGGSCVLGDFGLMKRLDGQEEEDKEVLKESIGPGMPFYYRTPDLVRYLNGDAPLSPKTDVFQLGLVLAQVFTGHNPLRVSDDFSAGIELDPLGHIPSSFGRSIASLIKRMLIVDEADRPSAHDLLGGWQGVFKGIVNESHKLDDRAFRFG